MDLLALAIAVLALLVALAARARAGAAQRRAEALEADLRRVGNNVAQHVEGALSVQRRHLAQVVAGDPPTPEMILEGQLWRDVDARRARELVEAGEVALLDVRTAEEVAQGKLPGAQHIPVDELPARRGELPRDGRPLLVYCAMGGRSAAACELLGAEGRDGLLNLAGGIGAWQGPLERPS